jgi:hypothetical protein
MGLRMSIFPVLVVRLALSLAACGRDPGPKGDPGPQDPAGLKARRACKAFRAHKGKLAPRARKAPKVRQEKKGDKGEKGDAATVNVRAVQADGSVSCEANETLVSVFCPSGGAPDGAKCGTAPTVGLCLRKP